jgi:hypothetical protein
MPVLSKSVLSKEQRTYLEQVACSKEPIDTVEKEMGRDRRTYRGNIFGVFLTFLPFVAASISLFVKVDVIRDPTQQITEIILGLVLLLAYVAFSVFVVRAFLSLPEYRAFKALVKSMDNVDKAMEAKPAIGARRKLAAKLSRSAFKIRACGARMPWRLDRRILRQEANRACQALRQFVYPALLGTDDELRQVKVAIARAAIRVGTHYWVQVGDLAPDPVVVTKNMRPRLTWAGIISFVIILIPLITALVTALASGKNGQTGH